MIGRHKKFLTESPVRNIREPSRGCRSGLLRLAGESPRASAAIVCLFGSLRFKIFRIEVKIYSMALYQDHLFLASFLLLKTSHKYFLYLARQDRQAMTLHTAIFRAHFWQGLPYHRVCLADHDRPQRGFDRL
jgi:hypothetical protein